MRQPLCAPQNMATTDFNDDRNANFDRRPRARCAVCKERTCCVPQRLAAVDMSKFRWRGDCHREAHLALSARWPAEDPLGSIFSGGVDRRRLHRASSSAAVCLDVTVPL
ncbi:unnamed protein product [Ostreobium quekettii]|uniref:Uncharacterized protein n=1 Tax=Ostreobium quekettii TaxID=121088 RepID=A0A8S1IYH6_9CHLO|nr:unnamed protein product [Ostreobium quekettii]